MGNGSDSEIPDTKRRIIPLFQVSYDRSLCRPLGTLIDFSRFRQKSIKAFSSPPTRDFSPSRSPSPVYLETAPSPLNDSTPTLSVQTVKPIVKKTPDTRQNALAVFEFSTVYPFVYGSNKFKCFVCSQPFLDLNELKLHMHFSHTFAPLKRLVNNRRENVLKVDVSDITCKICSEKPPNFLELKRHLKEVHEKPVDLEIQDNMIPFNLELVDDAYKCVVCEQSFIKVRILVIHMSEHFNNYSCEICGSVFMTLRLLKKHLEVHDSGNFPCDRCNKIFSTPYKRTLHIRGVHLKQCPRRCPMCPEKFNSNYKRTIHLQDVHNQETRVHKCKTCGRGFNLKYHLVCHVRSVHLQERNQQCDVCHQRFCNKESLKRHMVIHTGEKNHKCDVCGMAFLRRKNLKDHLRLHDISIIQKSNSTITLKDEDGTEIKLTVLKYPISLDALQYEAQDMITANHHFKNKRKKKISKTKKAKKSNVKLENISLLKEPVSINNVDWKNHNEHENSVTFNVKTVQGYIRAPTRQRSENVDYETWKHNALIIFENSYVYPFIHAGNKYKCVICSRPFLDANLLKDHTINEHTSKEMKRALNNRVREKNLKVDVTYLQCKICLQSLPDLQNLKTHLKEHGKKIQPDLQDNNIIPYKLGGENFECQVCGEKYLKLRLLIIHMSKHFNNYSCEICGSVFISLQLLKRHLQVHESGSFPCSKCDKVFTNSTKRSLHYKGVHLKQFPRRCPICPERFNSNYQRTKHLRIAHNQSTGLYRCDTCGREYDLKYHLLVHIRSVHLQERNHECSMCNSRFFSKYCLSRHMVIHTGEKNFKCEVCGKAYARRKNLREHCRSHEVGLCAICGLNCGDHNNLVAHVNSVH